MKNLYLKKLILPFLSFFLINPARSAVITVPLNYTVTAGDTGSLTGSFTIDTSLDSGNDRNTDLGFQSSIPGWITEVTISYTDAGDSANNFSRSKTGGTITNMVWEVKSGVTPDFNSSNLQDDFDGLGFGGLNLSANLDSKQQDAGENEFTLTSTPSPSILLGILPFLFYLKKLKKYKLY